MTSVKTLHVVSFDNPFPPNYGGVIDVFFKIRNLHAAGVSVILHAFEYGRAPSKELEKYCSSVFYYKRKKITWPFSLIPHIVASRKNELLLKRLLDDDAPILFEGLHTCFYLAHRELKQRNKLVRMHNIEHEYYRNLKEVENRFLKKIFFAIESKRLSYYESVLGHANHVLAISPNDANYLSSKYNNVEYVPAFHSNSGVTSKTGRGEYAFYHGKLSIGENDQAARFLVERVFSKTNKKLFIAGDHPSQALIDLVRKAHNVTLFEKVSTENIASMIADAHINVLPTFQATGIKLKLINVLYQGRFVLANREMVENTGCESLCSIADNEEDFAKQIDRLFEIPYAADEIRKKEVVLQNLFDNNSNIGRLMRLL